MAKGAGKKGDVQRDLPWGWGVAALLALVAAIGLPVAYQSSREQPLSDGIRMDGAKLAGARLQGGSLTHASLRGAALSGADLSGVDLSWADLRGADLSGANLTGALLAHACLYGATFDDATLARADLTGAHFSNELRSATTRLTPTSVTLAASPTQSPTAAIGGPTNISQAPLPDMTSSPPRGLPSCDGMAG